MCSFLSLGNIARGKWTGGLIRLQHLTGVLRDQVSAGKIDCAPRFACSRFGNLLRNSGI